MIKLIDVHGLKAKIDNKEDIKILDVREQQEWDEGHIKEAQFLPLSQLETQFEAAGNKDQEIIIQCRSGKRSMKACEFLAEKGYQNLINLEGGILSWQDEGFEVTK